MLKDFEEVGRLAEARAGIGGEPAIGVMHRELPRRSAAHREAADGDAVFIDAAPLFDRVEGFQDVDLAREFVGVAIAAVRVQDDGVFRRVLAEIAGAVVDEIQLAQRFAAAMKPQVAAEATGG